MKAKKAVLVILLLALALAITGSVTSAREPPGPGGPTYYGVNLSGADPDAVYVQATSLCPCPCNTHGVGEGYSMYIGYGDSKSECTRNTFQPGYLRTLDPLAIRWHPAQGYPAVGDVACIFWCCQPYPAAMYFHWEFTTVTD